MDLSANRDRLAELILRRSFQYREDPPFTLASGKTSFFYFNCKPVTLDPEGMSLIGRVLFGMIRGTGVTAAGGLTLGADPLANALSVISFQEGEPIKSFIVRKDVKAHGTKSAVEGNVAKGEHVVVLDDVITTADRRLRPSRRPASGPHRGSRHCPHRPGGRRARKHLALVGRVDAVFTRTEIMERYRKI